MGHSNRFHKDFHRLMRRVDKMSDNQVTVTDWDDDCLTKFTLDVKPNGGPYKGGHFHFEISDVCVDDDYKYPRGPPLVRCLTNIYHPNIDPTSQEFDDEINICINLLDEWSESFNLEMVIQGILFLFYEPNLDDPLSPYFSGVDDYNSYLKDVERSMRGEEIDGITFDQVIINESDVKENDGIEQNHDNPFSDPNKMTDNQDTTESHDINLILEKLSYVMIEDDQPVPNFSDTKEEATDENEVNDLGATVQPTKIQSTEIGSYYELPCLDKASDCARSFTSEAEATPLPFSTGKMWLRQSSITWNPGMHMTLLIMNKLIRIARFFKNTLIKSNGINL